MIKILLQETSQADLLCTTGFGHLEVALLVWIPEVSVPEVRIPLVFGRLQYETRRDHDDVFPR